MTNGRGAWSSVGGTLRYDKSKDKTVPGPYYMADVNNLQGRIGLKVHNQLLRRETPERNEYVVYLAAREIQKWLNRTGAKLTVDGIVGPASGKAIENFQKKNNLYVDGVLGRSTSTALVLPELKVVSKASKADWKVVAGLIGHESSFDIGAVGYYDDDDIGLGQINGPANPYMSIGDRVDVDNAVRYVAERLNMSISIYGGNVRDAVASYNLGIAGANAWIRAGRPDIWTPAGSSVSRNVKYYIDSILNAF